ncbi:MAG TPA: CoA pyrophosphatase [Candidatus Marinimicrobia bacterium]|nr:CoA pyrophosphatase [Candidatus Neomarinimicrobiota bacterium]HIB52662.1 CoA pyrophosphatase [Candidatus Neomarinimicrobiota bacterium]
MKIKLAQHLVKELPGKPAQKIMLTKPRNPINYSSNSECPNPAAVLILLFPVKQDIRFFLTKRTNVVQYHKGQISLPGGAWEEGEQLWGTALRETNEEIGVREDHIQFIGELTPLFVPVTGFLIHPFVGWVDEEPETSPDPTEVESLFSASVLSLTDQNSCQCEERTIRGHVFDVPYFQLNREKVWGATSMILSEFKTVLKEVIDE